MKPHCILVLLWRSLKIERPNKGYRKENSNIKPKLLLRTLSFVNYNKLPISYG